MAQLMANQNAANQNNQSGLEVAGMAQNRALQAGQAAGQLGSQMEGQQYAQQAQRAAAQDAIAQFNARNALQNAQYKTNNNKNDSIHQTNTRTKISILTIFSYQRSNSKIKWQSGTEFQTLE